MTKNEFGIQIEGLDEVQRTLRRMSGNIKNLSGETPVELILTPKFMAR